MKGGVTGEAARPANKYNQNFAGTFCGCGDVYDPAKEKGTMFQCLGLGHLDNGGCGEDWWHPECLMGLPHGLSKTHPKEIEDPAPVDVKTEDTTTTSGDQPSAEGQEKDAVDEDALPPGFPAEDAFDHLLCYKCVEANPWIKAYAGTEGFLPAIHYKGNAEANEPASSSITTTASSATTGSKRKLEDEKEETDTKRSRLDDVPEETTAIDHLAPIPTEPAAPKHTLLPPPPSGKFSIFVKEDFRDHLCRCPTCFPRLRLHPQLLEAEDPYEPPVSESDDEEADHPNGGGSVGSRSLLDRGEAALSTMDRMRAIEGVMAYNHLRDKVKAFLQPFAESGQAVGAEDVKAYFARLRGDEDAMRAAASGAGGNGDEGGDGRREQSGY